MNLALCSFRIFSPKIGPSAMNMASYRPFPRIAVFNQAISPCSNLLAARRCVAHVRRLTCVDVRADASKGSRGVGGSDDIPRWRHSMGNSGSFMQGIVPRGILFGAALSLASMQVCLSTMCAYETLVFLRATDALRSNRFVFVGFPTSFASTLESQPVCKCRFLVCCSRLDKRIWRVSV